MLHPTMLGMLCIARSYEYPDNWWIGLVLIDPAFRGQGIGHMVVTQVMDRARASYIVAMAAPCPAASVIIG